MRRVRIRTELPAVDGPNWQLAIVRAPLDRLQLKLLPDGRVVAEDSFFLATDDENPWPENFLLPLPAELAGKSEFYLLLQGEVNGGLHLRLQDPATARAEEDQGRQFFRFTYGLLLMVAVLSLVRHVEDTRSGAPAVGGAALGLWLACLGINGHLYSLPEVALLSGLGAVVPQALFLLGAGPLVLATLRYSGLAKSAPPRVGWMRGLGWLLVAGALFALTLPGNASIALQWVAWVCYPVALLACVVMLLLDSRSYRWAPLVTLAVMGGAVLLRVLADHQVVAVNWWTLYGWQLLLALVMVQYLGLPWTRARIQRWAMRKRSEPREPSAEEKIEAARGKLMASLQHGLNHADDDDVAWIAYRRLLDGLKAVLPQDSSAVVGEHADGEELLQVEPRTAEARYRELMSQRTTLLRNLSKLKAAQQGRKIKVIGVQAKNAASYVPSLKAGKEVEIKTERTIADGIAVAKPGHIPFELIAKHIDKVVTVSDDEIAKAIVVLMERSKQVVEPAGAAAVAALMSGVVKPKGKTVAVLSGGNIDPLLMQKIIGFGLTASERYTTISVMLPDRPGQLVRTAEAVAAAHANVVEVLHTRHGNGLQISEVELNLSVETRGKQHRKDLMKSLKDAGLNPRLHED